MTITRRSLLHYIARSAGAGATFAAMTAMGLAAGAQASPLGRYPGRHGSGKRVLVLGGGIAGLSAALELEKIGFDVQVLEANARPGGRSWTIRGGDTVTLAGGEVQGCTWADGNYLNAGPARIPSTHRHLLAYCNALGVPLEVEVNSSRSALLQSDAYNAGQPFEQRQALNDTRGFVSELLAKAINRHSLDDSLSPDEIHSLLPFLRDYGDLDKDYRYLGSRRSGYAVQPGAGPGTSVVRKPLDFNGLVKANLLRGMLYEEHIDWQATMMQPVGGMDRIARAMAGALGAKVKYSRPVTGMFKAGEGVRITCSAAGGTETFLADFAICAMPGQIARSVPSDFTPATRQALDKVKGDAHFKLAWEAPRFWETQYNIYGGLSFLSNPLIDTIWYPSGALQSETGVVVAGFGQDIDAKGQVTAFGKLSLAGKLAASRAAVETLHPGHSRLLDKPIYLPWHRVPNAMGALSIIEPASFEQVYQHLNEPDGPFHFAGDWLSRLNGWQEGAVLSAHRAVASIADRAAA